MVAHHSPDWRLRRTGIITHAYDAFAGTPQEKRFNELRDNAIARMFETKNDSNVSEDEEGFEGIMKYLVDMYNAEQGK